MIINQHYFGEFSLNKCTKNENTKVENLIFIKNIGNIEDVETSLLEKLKFFSNEKVENTQNIYIKFSIFEKLYPVSVILLIPFIANFLVVLFENGMTKISFVCIIFFVLTGVKIWKKKYKLEIFDENKIVIKNKRERMYVIDEFEILENKVVIDYKFGFETENKHCFYEGLLPNKYFFEKKRENEDFG